MQEKCNSIANTLELHISRTNRLICWYQLLLAHWCPLMPSLVHAIAVPSHYLNQCYFLISTRPHKTHLNTFCQQTLWRWIKLQHFSSQHIGVIRTLRNIPWFASTVTLTLFINSSPPSTAYMHHLIGSALVQIMACRLFGAKPLSKPMLGYCQLDP